jgi:hypothetical protein
MLFKGMRSGTGHAKAIERCQAQSPGEIPVTAATGLAMA